MTKSNSILTLLALVLGSLYCYFFTDLFKHPTIQIIPQNRLGWHAAGDVNPVSFSLDGTYALTMIKVVPVSALQTNKFATPAWYLVTKTNSAPTKGFLYGGKVQGMNPSDLKPHPDALEPDTTYRLFVEAGRATGQVDFRPAAAAPAEGQ